MVFKPSMKATSRKGAKRRPAWRFSEIVLSVLGYREGDEWVALALDVDLRGYGATFEEALEELGDLVSAQFDFARFKGQPQMFLHPAAPEYFHLYASARTSQLQLLSESSSVEEMEYRAGGISIPPPHVIAKMKDGFTLADA